MQPEIAKQYRQRWALVAELERQEQRQATFAQRWQHLNAILRFGNLLVRNAPPEETAAVNARWRRLKEQHERTR